MSLRERITMFGTIAWYLNQVADWLYGIRDTVERIPIVGYLLTDPVNWMAWCFSQAAWEFDFLDDTIESLKLGWIRSEGLAVWIMHVMDADIWEIFFWRHHFIGWVLYRVGFEVTDALMFESSPGWFIRWKITTWFDYLDPILDDPFGWIRERIIERVPALGYLFEDPSGWVLYMLGVPWFERFFWSDHLLAWLLHRWGLDIAEALIFEADPIFWVKYQVLKRWDFLDDLLLDPPSWIWDKFTQAVDRYIDVNLDWLVKTGERVLSSIWQMRL